MDQLSTAIILTVFLATCTTDIPDRIREDLLARDDLPCEQDSGEIDTHDCSAEEE